MSIVVGSENIVRNTNLTMHSSKWDFHSTEKEFIYAPKKDWPKGKKIGY